MSNKTKLNKSKTRFNIEAHETNDPTFFQKNTSPQMVLKEFIPYIRANPDQLYRFVYSIFNIPRTQRTNYLNHSTNKWIGLHQLLQLSIDGLAPAMLAMLKKPTSDEWRKTFNVDMTYWKDTIFDSVQDCIFLKEKDTWIKLPRYNTLWSQIIKVQKYDNPKYISKDHVDALEAIIDLGGKLIGPFDKDNENPRLKAIFNPVRALKILASLFNAYGKSTSLLHVASYLDPVTIVNMSNEEIDEQVDVRDYRGHTPTQYVVRYLYQFRNKRKTTFDYIKKAFAMFLRLLSRGRFTSLTGGNDDMTPIIVMTLHKYLWHTKSSYQYLNYLVRFAGNKSSDAALHVCKHILLNIDKSVFYQFCSGGHDHAVAGIVKYIKLCGDNKLLKSIKVHKTERKTAFMSAIQNNHTWIVQYLVDQKIACFTPNCYGKHPIYFATMASTQMFRYIMDVSNVDHDSIKNMKTNKGSNLYFAILERLPAKWRMDLDGILDTLRRFKVDINEKNNVSESVLYRACVNDDYPSVMALLTHGANVNVEYNNHPLSHKIYHSTLNNKKKFETKQLIIYTLFSHGLNPAHVINFYNPNKPLSRLKYECIHTALNMYRDTVSLKIACGKTIMSASTSTPSSSLLRLPNCCLLGIFTFLDAHKDDYIYDFIAKVDKKYIKKDSHSSLVKNLYHDAQRLLSRFDNLKEK